MTKKKLSEKMVYRAIDALLEVVDRLPERNQELSMAIDKLNHIIGTINQN